MMEGDNEMIKTAILMVTPGALAFWFLMHVASAAGL